MAENIPWVCIRLSIRLAKLDTRVSPDNSPKLELVHAADTGVLPLSAPGNRFESGSIWPGPQAPSMIEPVIPKEVIPASKLPIKVPPPESPGEELASTSW